MVEAQRSRRLRLCRRRGAARQPSGTTWRARIPQSMVLGAWTAACRGGLRGMFRAHRVDRACGLPDTGRAACAGRPPLQARELVRRFIPRGRKISRTAWPDPVPDAPRAGRKIPPYRVQVVRPTEQARSMVSRIAYCINQYPKVSHAFIQREINALERQGFEILRISLRGWDSELVDADSHRERARTRYVLRDGILPLLLAMFRMLLAAPWRFWGALALAIRMGRHAERPLAYHVAYFAEACRILPWLRSFGATHIHAHFGTNSAEVVMLAHALGGPPYSFTVHGPYEFDKPEFLGINEKLRRAAFVVAVSSFGRGQLFRWVEHAHWHKIKIVHGGLDDTFHASAATPPPTAPRLVCVGRLCAEKGQLLLVEAARCLAAKNVV